MLPEAMHPVLRRQLRQYSGRDHLVDHHSDWLGQIDSILKTADDDRNFLEHSLECASDELKERYLTLLRGLATAQTQRQEILSKEEALRRSNEFLTSILGSISAGILVLDHRCRIIFHNAQAVSILESDQLSGYPIYRFLPGLHGPFLRLFVQVLKAGHAHTLDLERNQERALVQYLRCSMARLNIPSTHNVVMVLEDVTLARLTRQHFTQTSKLVTLGEMASGVVHQISQPLTVIQMAAEMLSEVSHEPRLERQFFKERTSSILEMTRRAQDTISQLLLFARGADPDFQVLTALWPLQNALHLLKERLRLARITVVQNLPEPDMVLVNGSANQLEQIFINILTNSMDALSVVQDDKRIEIVCKQSADWIEVTISNNGPAIPAEIMDRIFQPFYTTKPPGKGTGLGLSVSLGIVQAHGGSLLAMNTGNGAAFRIQLPRSGATVGQHIDRE